MQHKYCFEAVHRTFQDICDDPYELCMFGGKPVVLGGDFAQIPPVIRRGNRADTVSASVKQSFLWSRLQLLRLTQNMRLTNLLNQNDIAFAQFISIMSYNHRLYGSMTFPSYIHQTKQLNEFISKVYKDDEIINSMTIRNGQYFGERAILATRNDTVGRINEVILDKMHSEKVTLLSTDSADINEADSLHSVPAEYLHSLNPTCLPPSKLELKVGAPIMLLRNIDPARDLCNGARLIVVHTSQYLLRVRLAHKPDAPTETIPRFTLSSQEGDMPFMLTRKQFLVKLCFAMTINKPQGQSLKYVGVDRRQPSFMHGKLYVALSRATSLSGISVLLPEGSNATTNVVYPELLLS
ncbi:hypothetical protein G6F70_002138 [Rhizopus microsporus]|nr:hypothetical protein G6F71_000707 [Rhizopus microsporus]KAG1202575.1 hypothetical protein G6F70_002138 [Rhizopus microsporus]KAG1212132.1 hypothetical protein G6F69_003982 [Rhizopus microsporus]KAG1232301.1 hypothetical protein G6F67_005113 [Rhizopus microsporus]KAG1266319.1 hypothetical protein G6F68_002858 [Rhizopus microsporus]